MAEKDAIVGVIIGFSITVKNPERISNNVTNWKYPTILIAQ